MRSTAENTAARQHRVPVSENVSNEIDARMDQNRTANTVALLESLKSWLSQILLVTHKKPEADYVVEMDES